MQYWMNVAPGDQTWNGARGSTAPR